MAPEDVVQERIDAALVGMVPESNLHDRSDCKIWYKDLTEREYCQSRESISTFKFRAFKPT